MCLIYVYFSGFHHFQYDKKCNDHLCLGMLLLQKIPEADQKLLSELLSQDPRDRFIHDNSRIWGLTYGNYNIRFQVHDNVLTVSEVTGL